jgi:hypothetical protein
MTVKEFLICTYEIVDVGIGNFQTRRPHVMCNDGFTISIQADEFMYCLPRENLTGGEYTHVELGFPSEKDELIEKYREGTVYPYVPIELVEKLIEKHGGLMKTMTRCESYDLEIANNALNS